MSRTGPVDSLFWNRISNVIWTNIHRLRSDPFLCLILLQWCKRRYCVCKWIWALLQEQRIHPNIITSESPPPFDLFQAKPGSGYEWVICITLVIISSLYGSLDCESVAPFSWWDKNSSLSNSAGYRRNKNFYNYKDDVSFLPISICE